MAHQTDMHVVRQEFKEQDGPSENVVDPVCGMKLERRDSKHVVFRESGTFYFCSRECKDRFLTPGLGKKAG